MKYKQVIAAAVQESTALRSQFGLKREEWLLAAATQIAKALADGRKILIAGNGGSAADSQHFATEFVVRLTAENDRQALPAIALTTDGSLLTAASNDYGFERIFSRQIEALGQAGDIFIGLTTSGRSANILAAFRSAKERGLVTIGLFGAHGLSQPELCNHALCVPSSSTMRIQEEHIFALHLLAQIAEDMILSEGKPASESHSEQRFRVSEPHVADKKSVKLELEPGTYWWCQCGRSADQPFCDGSHHITDFEPLEFTITEKRLRSYCQCKRTKTPPFCDGTHKELP